MTNSKEAEDLKKALERAKIGLETARNHFQYAQDAELVDYYTYVMIANEKLYSYLNKKYKEICDVERVSLNGIS